MIQILEYITQNYTLFLCILVLILLAIIGYFADKTVFGQGKNKDKDSKEISEDAKALINADKNEQKSVSEIDEKTEILNVESLKENSIDNDLKDKEKYEYQQNRSNVDVKNENLNLEEQKEGTTIDTKKEMVSEESHQNISVKGGSFVEENDEVNLIEKQKKDVEKSNETEKNDLFYNEIDLLLPKKELINDDLLNEIESMEIKSLKEKNSFNVPDLDDIKLPKIKNLVEKEQDIWKF